MDEHLIPSAYHGDGYGIAVMFGGLNQSYDSLEISIDGGNFILCERDKDEPFFTYPKSFGGLEEKRFYTIFGRITMNGQMTIIQCAMSAKKEKAVLRAMLLSEKTEPQYCGGSQTPKPARPMAMEG